MEYRIFPPEGLLETTVGLPASKSIAARDIILCYLCGRMALVAPLAQVCGDTRVLYTILSTGLPTDGAEVNVGASGTAMRFLTALAAATEGTRCILAGDARMSERPIGPLVDALRALGAHIEYKGAEGFPPIEIRGCKLAGGDVTVDASVSSQFVSALMMAGPLMAAPLTIHFTGNVQSLPYINMTAAMMERYGVKSEVDRDKAEIGAGPYKGAVPVVEADWSAAAFWYEIAALTAGWVTLEHLKEDTLQGDSQAAKLFERLGVLTEFTDAGAELSATPDLWNSLDADMCDMPDAVPALAVTAVMAGIPFRLTGVGALHDKESDRLQALVDELIKVGAVLEIENYGNTLVWEGRRVPVRQLPEFDSHGDHRIAMALAPVSVFMPGILVRGAEVVEKSYPGFWANLSKAGFIIIDPARLAAAKEGAE